MDIIMGGRAWGKTHAAVGWVKENPGAVLVVHDENARRHIIQQHGLTEQQVITYNSGKNFGRGRRNEKKLVVDNLDLFLSMYFHMPVEMVTAPAGRIVMAGADAANDPGRFIRPSSVHPNLPYMDPAFVPEPMQRTVRAAGEPMVDPLSRWFPPFNEDTLQADIYFTWGEHGAHADVWRSLRRDAQHARTLEGEVQLLNTRNATQVEMIRQRDAELASRERDAAGHHERIRLLSLRIDEQARLSGGLRNDLARAVGDVINTEEYRHVVNQLNEERREHTEARESLRRSKEAHAQLRSYTDSKLSELANAGTLLSELQGALELAQSREHYLTNQAEDLTTHLNDERVRRVACESALSAVTQLAKLKEEVIGSLSAKVEELEGRLYRIRMESDPGGD